MDENKLNKLHDVGYTIHKSCGLCKHGLFKDGNNYGVCLLHTYFHLKHTDKKRQLSINQYGECTSFKKNIDLGTWHEFI